MPKKPSLVTPAPATANTAQIINGIICLLRRNIHDGFDFLFLNTITAAPIAVIPTISIRLRFTENIFSIISPDATIVYMTKKTDAAIAKQRTASTFLPIKATAIIINTIPVLRNNTDSSIAVTSPIIKRFF